MLIMALTLALFMQVSAVAAFEFDLTSRVTWVVDGDTFDIETGDRIRLADINTPEVNEAGYGAAKAHLISRIYNKTVYLDIDDQYRYDTTGTRIVCVAYVDFNSTHCFNVNKDLLDGGYAALYPHQNEFEPSDWTLYVQKAGGGQAPDAPWNGAAAYLALIAAIAVAVLLIAASKNKQR